MFQIKSIHNKQGFTFIETVITLVIISVLFAIGFITFSVVLNNIKTSDTLNTLNKYSTCIDTALINASGFADKDITKANNYSYCITYLNQFLPDDYQFQYNAAANTYYSTLLSPNGNKFELIFPQKTNYGGTNNSELHVIIREAGQNGRTYSNKFDVDDRAVMIVYDYINNQIYSGYYGVSAKDGKAINISSGDINQYILN